MLVSEIVKQLPNSKISYDKKDEDPRDYRVDFNKIKDTFDFRITKKVPEGISQVIELIKNGILNNPDDSKYKNI